MEFVFCPEPGCTFEAEVEERYELRSSEPGGHTAMVRIRCVLNHWFNMSADGLTNVRR